MLIQSVQDNGLVKGVLDLKDQVTVRSGSGEQTATIENYLMAKSECDSAESPSIRLANVLKQAPRLPVNMDITNFVNEQTRLWNSSHPEAVSEGQRTQCPKGTTLVTAAGSVTNNFCIDNEATYKFGGFYLTWPEAKDYCEAAGKFLLTYEQEKLGAKSTNFEVVRNSGRLEWVLSSSGDDSRGQTGGFFVDDDARHYSGELLFRDDPGVRFDNVVFRCGGSPLPQD